MFEYRPFPEVKKNFGFGCMRLPMVDDKVDNTEFCKMVDAFLENGFNYFDTAHGYLGGKSEIALRECLTSRYPRDKYLLVDKLSANHFDSEEEIRPLFEEKLAACGVEYFDFYLLHAQDRGKFAKYKKCRAYETAFDLKAEGKVRHVGLSFHDTAAVLDQITVDYYGVATPIRQIASISSPDPRTLTIQPWDKSTLKLIEKAILTSELGINPQNDGVVIRLVFPQLTEERRKELAKQVRKYGEDGKVAVRNIRRDAMDKFKKMQKNNELTEDDLKIMEKDLQKLTDDYIKEVDKLTEKKEKELFSI